MSTVAVPERIEHVAVQQFVPHLAADGIDAPTLPRAALLGAGHPCPRTLEARWHRCGHELRPVARAKVVGRPAGDLRVATWTAAGIGVNQGRVMEWALARDADGVRTGLEDNIRITRGRLPASNAELVQLAAEAIVRHGREVASSSTARRLLGLAA